MTGRGHGMMDHGGWIVTLLTTWGVTVVHQANAFLLKFIESTRRVKPWRSTKKFLPIEYFTFDVLENFCLPKTQKATDKKKRCTSNKGQSSLALGGIAANPGFRPPNPPFLWGDRVPCLVQCDLGLQECPCQVTSHSVQRLLHDARVWQTTYIHTVAQTTLR